MKVIQRNLIYGLLALGFTVAAQASGGSDAMVKIENALQAPVAQRAAVMEADFDLSELENVISTRLARQEVLRESLRAWADKAEAAQKRRNNGLPHFDTTLARY